MTELTRLFDAFAQQKVMVIGDVMIDAYAWGKVDRISPEAPVPILQVERREARLGGAANVALNLQAMGATPILCSVVGHDLSGHELLKLMEHDDLPTTGMLQLNGRQTTVKQRMLSGSHQLLRIDAEDTHYLNSEDEAALWDSILTILPEVQVVVFEDYDKGVITPALIERVVVWCNRHNIPTVVDPKKRNFLHYKGVTLFKPNLKELREGLQISVDPRKVTSLEEAATKLCEALDLQGTLITLSEHGMFLRLGGEHHRVMAHLRNIADVSGAGDTVVSVAALCLAAGANAELLLELANLSGGLVCEHVGVVPINRDDLLQEAQSLLVTKQLNY